MSIVAWAILLLLIGLVILVLEFLIPSSGVLGVLATMAIIGSIWLGFMYDLRTGTVLLLTAVIVVPILLFGAIKYWPDTPIGRRMLIQPPTDDELRPPEDPHWHLTSLIGKRGRSRTEMLPGGTVEVDGRRFDAVSDSGAIEASTPIIVLRLETNRLVVRADDSPIVATLVSAIDPAIPTSSVPETSGRSGETEPRKNNSETLIPGPFEEPLI